MTKPTEYQSATVPQAQQAEEILSRWRWVVVLALLASLLSVAGVLVSKPPLSVHLVSVRTTGQLATVVELGVVHAAQVSPYKGVPARAAFDELLATGNLPE